MASEDYLYKFGDDALDGAGEQLVPGVLPQQRTHRHLVDECVLDVLVDLVCCAGAGHRALHVVER